MKLQQAQRHQVKMKLALQGIAGSGKTYSSLLLAKGLSNNNLEKVAVIDCEAGSSNLYAHLFSFKILKIESPYTPEKYIKAIDICLEANVKTIIIDGISSCWTYLLSYHANLIGNSFFNWKKVTEKQDAFIRKIIQAPVHIIATMRTKHAYVINQVNGKSVPEKIGLKAIQRNNVDFEFDTVININSNHVCNSTKDRTGLFQSRKDFIIYETIGDEILKWCNLDELKEDITSQIIPNKEIVKQAKSQENGCEALQKPS